MSEHDNKTARDDTAVSPGEAPLAVSDLRSRFEHLIKSNGSAASSSSTPSPLSSAHRPAKLERTESNQQHHRGLHLPHPAPHIFDHRTHHHSASAPAASLSSSATSSRSSSPGNVRGPRPARPPKPHSFVKQTDQDSPIKEAAEAFVGVSHLRNTFEAHASSSTHGTPWATALPSASVLPTPPPLSAEDQPKRGNSIGSISDMTAALEWAESNGDFPVAPKDNLTDVSGQSTVPSVHAASQAEPMSATPKDDIRAFDNGKASPSPNNFGTESIKHPAIAAKALPQPPALSDSKTVPVASGTSSVSQRVPLPTSQSSLPPTFRRDLGRRSSPVPLSPSPPQPTPPVLPPRDTASTSVPKARPSISPHLPVSHPSLPPPPQRTAIHPPPLLRTRQDDQSTTLPSGVISSSDSESEEDDLDFESHSPLPAEPLSRSAPPSLAPPLNRTGAIGRAGRKPSDSGSGTVSAEALPDASRANRRPPSFFPPRTVSSKHFTCAAVCGHTICIGSGDKVRVYRVGPTARPGNDKLCSLVAEKGGKEVKVTVMAFRPPAPGTSEGRYLWCGTKEGHLWEMDIAEATVTNVRHNVHTASIVVLERMGARVLSMDESGKICVWQPASPQDAVSLTAQPVSQRITLEKGSVVLPIGQQLWSCAGACPPIVQHHANHSGGLHLPSSASAAVSAAGFGSHGSNGYQPRQASVSASGPRIKILNPYSLSVPFNATSRPLGLGEHARPGIGAVTCGTLLQVDPDKVYLGHDSGHISIWDRRKLCCVAAQRLSTLGFTALCAVGDFLWAANRSGRITIYRPAAAQEQGHWQVIKSWQAHKQPIISLRVDATALDPDGQNTPVALPVISTGLDYAVQLWDGTLAEDFVAFRLSKRVSEYSSYRSLRMLQVTYNIDAASPAMLNSSAAGMEWVPELLSTATNQGDGEQRPPDVVTFGFQEVVDLEDKGLTAKSMLLNAANRGRGKVDMGEKVSQQYRQWTDRLVQSVRLAMPPDTPYKVIHSESMVGLLTCTLVKASEMPHVSDVAASTVKTGLGGRWGNKGAIVSRFALDDTSCCFINAHLAAGQKHVKQRNNDLAQILEAESLPPGKVDDAVYVGGGDGELILDHELVFVGGDLNYRIDLPRNQVLAMIDDQSWAGLVAKDQLSQELRRCAPTFRLRGFSEAGPLTFAPTYKFDRNTDDYDTSEKSRVPAWCDRLLHRDAAGNMGSDDAERESKSAVSTPVARVRCLQYRSWPTLQISDHRPVSAVYDFQVKRVDQEARAAVRAQEVMVGQERLRDLLERARIFYRDMWKD